jgi:NAD(P)-dependent dehydrogenase (short-subunit alcohol dehydrogenase family)
MATVAYPMSTPEDLDETVNLVENVGRRIVAEHGDVRDFASLQAAVANGVAELGRVDFVLASAGILPMVGAAAQDISMFDHAVDVMLTGAHGGIGYIAAKHGVVAPMRAHANMLAENNIRVNTAHPTGLNSPMIVNPQVEQLLAEQPEYASVFENLPAVPLSEPSDISEAMLYLCGRSGRYITGITLPCRRGIHRQVDLS